MLSPSVRRVLRLLAVAPAIMVAVSACDSPPSEIHSVADFDANPCVLFTDDVMTQTITEGYGRLAGVPPKLIEVERGEVGDDTVGCVYRFEADGTAEVPQIANVTVAVQHNKNGSQPLAICIAGAGQRADGYRLHKVGDQACTTPSSDMWMKIGENVFQIVVAPQPGFDNPVDASLALSPIILAVAEATAARMPKS